MLYSENIRISKKGITFTDKQGRTLSSTEATGKIINRMQSWWKDFKLLIVNRSGWCPFWTWRKFVYRLAGLKIGKGSKVHVFARFFEPKNIEIGEDSVVGESAFLDGRTKIEIGSHVDIASQVLIYNSQHDIDDTGFGAIEKPVAVEDYVFIGPRAIILPGVKIGRGAVVAAGAVVTRDVEAGKVVGGVPAREIRTRKLTDFKYRLGRKRLFQ